METIAAYLKAREEQGLLRRLRPFERRDQGRLLHEETRKLDLSSNDYLGLSQHPRLREAARDALDKYGTATAAARLLSGDLALFHELEERTAQLKGKEAALVFNSGYQANVGILSALCTRKDAVFCDRLCHASLLDGATLNGARLYRFRHNDPGHLQNLLKKTEGRFERRLVVTESIFSMDGDLAPLQSIVDIVQGQRVLLLVDEAHATGVTGPDGSGLVSALNLHEQVDLVMGTYSKALGGFGGYVACDGAMKLFLINAARSFIYSTALPPAVIATNLAALDVLRDEPYRRVTLQNQTAWFRTELQQRSLPTCGTTQIVPWIVGEANATQALSDALDDRDYYVRPVRPPTVPPGQSRLRFSLSYAHSRRDLLGLLAAIDEVRDV